MGVVQNKNQTKQSQTNGLRHLGLPLRRGMERRGRREPKLLESLVPKRTHWAVLIAQKRFTVQFY